PTFVAVTVVLNCRPATTSSDDALISTLTSGPLLPTVCVAMVQLREAVEEFPTSSVACTSKVWSPTASPESETGLVQSTKGPPSMLHASAADGSSALNARDAEVALKAMRGGVRSDVTASRRAAV